MPTSLHWVQPFAQPPRVLCLHGYRGTASTLRQRMSALVAAQPALLDPVYIDAPSLRRGDFGWWHEGFTGWETSRASIIAVLEGGRFDGILGFSQGAAAAGLLAAEQHARSAAWFRFAVLISGFTSSLSQHAHLFRTPITIESLQIIGRADTIVTPPESIALSRRFADPTIVGHPGGHVVPSSRRVAEQTAAFMRTAHTTSVTVPDSSGPMHPRSNE